MKAIDLTNKINEFHLEIFSIKDLQKMFPNDSSIKIQIKRLIDKKILVRITKGIYKLPDSTPNLEKYSTQIYQPSYISFETALSKYGIINQGFYKITLATSRHSKKIELLSTPCEYIQIKPSLFFGFNLIDGLYLAEAEKAFLDEIYLITLGKRKINTDEWNLDNLNFSKINKYLKYYPKKVKEKVTQFNHQ